MTSNQHRRPYNDTSPISAHPALPLLSLRRRRRLSFYHVVARCAPPPLRARAPPLTPHAAYVDTNLVGTGKVAQAAILGQQGGVWAQSAGFNVRRARAMARDPC